MMAKKLTLLTALLATTIGLTACSEDNSTIASTNEQVTNPAQAGDIPPPPTQATTGDENEPMPVPEPPVSEQGMQNQNGEQPPEPPQGQNEQNRQPPEPPRDADGNILPPPNHGQMGQNGEHPQPPHHNGEQAPMPAQNAE